MAEDVSDRQLHDQVTRGETITRAGRVRLEAWYERQDVGEDALLNSPASATSASLEVLRGEVESALTQVSSVTRAIQALADENDTLRNDIAGLHRRLAQTTSPQAV